MAKTKFFRVATSGATTDGRQIDDQWLRDMAETYDPKTYQARVNIEHIRGAHPDYGFGAMGDVLALKAEPVTLNVAGREEQRLGLYAQIEALDPLVKFNKKGQKLFSSIEVEPNFAGSGKAYLRGLAVTDNPASLGTEMLQFCAQQGDKSPLASRKSAEGALFTAAEELVLEFAADDPDADDVGPTRDGIIAALAKVLGFSNTPAAPAAPEPPAAVVEAPVVPAFTAEALADALAPLFAANASAATAAAETAAKAASEASQAALTELSDKVAAITARLDTIPANGFTARQPATASEGSETKADC